MTNPLTHPGRMADARDEKTATWKDQDAVGHGSVRIYQGKRTEFGCEVTVDGKPLPLRSDLSGAATTSFGWGDVGGQQLSLALLSDFIGDDYQARRLHHEFAEKIIDQLPHDSWKMTGTELADALGSLGLRQPNRSSGTAESARSLCDDEHCPVSTAGEAREEVGWPERSIVSENQDGVSSFGSTVEADPKTDELDYSLGSMVVIDAAANGPNSFVEKTVEVTYGTVAKRAYEIWERKGGGDGHALDDWLEAEGQLLKSIQRSR